MQKPEKLIILLHPVLGPISDAEAFAAIPAHLTGIPTEYLHFRGATFTLEQLEHVDFEQLHRLQRQWFQTEAKPMLDRNPNCHVLYFGKSPIPSAAHLGALFSSWTKVDAMYNDHNTKAWYFERPPQQDNPIRVSEFHSSKGDGPVVIRLSTSLQVSPASTESVIPNPLVDIDISLTHLDRDACDGVMTKKFVDRIRKVLDDIHTKLPNRSGIHFFAAAPMGLLFEIGAALTPSIHFPISFYNYSGKNSPPYRVGASLNEEEARLPALTDQEKLESFASVKIWQEELAKIQECAQNLKSATAATCWLDHLYPGKNYFEKLDRNFCAQPSLASSRIVETSVSPTLYSLPSEFSLDPHKKAWELGELLLLQFVKMHSGDTPQLRQAIRLFLLHEAVHEEHQALRRSVATGVGRFSKTIEEIDYHADIWAILHELRMEDSTSIVERTKAILRNMLGSFMAFDKASQSSRPQVRRLNRYLIWLWQLAEIERLPATSDIHAVIETLLNKPVLEISGPEITTRDNRHYMVLDVENSPQPEVGIYCRGKFKQFQNGSTKQILEGFKQFDLEQMIEGVRGVYATTE